MRRGFAVLLVAVVLAIAGSALAADVEVSGSLGISSSFGTRLIHSFGTNNFLAGAGAVNPSMTGYWNNSFGVGTLSAITSGHSNTAMGNQALSANSTGNSNAAFGNGALFMNINGSNNVAVGDGALNSQTSGGGSLFETNNTAVGFDALFTNEAVCFPILIGCLPTGVWNTAIGAYALQNNSNGVSNTAVGYLAGSNNTTGMNNTFLGSGALSATGDLSNATVVGSGAIVDASNHVRIGNTDVTQIGGQVAWSNLSDIRSKKDIADIGLGLEFVRSLRPVQFRMINGNERIDFGFIAQDIESLVGSEYNILGVGADAGRTLSLRYTDFIAPMVKAVQEQQAQIEAQAEIIEDQREEISSMRIMINRLEARLSRIEGLLNGL